MIPEWKNGIIVSIFKKGDPTDHGNYRCISLIATCHKILLTMTDLQLGQKLENVKFLCKDQVGFRRKEEAIREKIRQATLTGTLKITHL
jgi:hypothetical protein